MRWLLCAYMLLSCETSLIGDDRPALPQDLAVKVTEAMKFPIITIEYQNNSNGPLRIWSASNSWGWRNLRFSVVLKDGRMIYIERKDRDFIKNNPNFTTVEGSKNVSRDVDLQDGWWDITELNDFKDVRYVSAIFAVAPTELGEKHGAWTGLSVSPWVAIQPKASK